MLPEPLPKHAVLLQGPNGPFFRRFARDLEAHGTRVTKINFNPGDALFFRAKNAINFRDKLDEWPAFFRELAATEMVDAVFLFGDCRPIHTAIRPITGELDIDVWVFEEGYLRPDYITLERDGVNGNSGLPDDPDFYRRAARRLPAMPPARPVGRTFRFSALYTILNACANTWFGWRYPHYRHHRNINAWRQAFLWTRGGFRKAWNWLRERRLTARFTGEWRKQYFFVPLQVHCDSQLGHSRFASVADFVREVTATFAASAPADTRLVFKHHPHDRPYRDYGRLVRELADAHDLGERLVYVHDLHLPTLLRNARGTITMNSTVGLSSLHHGTPVVAMGDAVYDIAGLTHDDTLASFFREPGEVDLELYEAFAAWVRYKTQINGSFHKRLRGSVLASGLAWNSPPMLLDSDAHPAPASDFR